MAWYLHQQSCVYAHSCNSLAPPSSDLALEETQMALQENIIIPGIAAREWQNWQETDHGKGNKLALQWGWCHVAMSRGRAIEVHWGV